ncbi:hypothetical protein TSUD_03270 [Trifolium subterraneum]|nr:hypothetical protein TSUD_03270 [Trifolium subterraneum]
MPKPKSADSHPRKQQSPPRRSPRLILLLQNNPTTPKPKSTNKSSIQSTPLTVPSLRRSPRFSNQNPLFNVHNKIDDAKLTQFPSRHSARVKQGKTNGGSNGGDEVIEVGVGGKRKSKRGGNEIVEGSKKELIEGEKEKRKCSGDEIVEGLKKEPVEGGAKRKRKHTCGGIADGWTKEQEWALRKAYFTANPTPNFWKNVSRMGKYTYRSSITEFPHIQESLI